MKLILTVRRPRNPLTAAARARHAGAHRPGPGARRQAQRRELRQDLIRLGSLHSP